MKKIISFSLWGSKAKYTTGALKNIELAPHIYPGWECRFYISEEVDVSIIKKINNYPHSKVIMMPENDCADREDGRAGAFWRFYPVSEESVDICIIRDTDSRLSYRERVAVDEWIKSEKSLHIMRDHERHQQLIMAGMWGLKGNLPNIKQMIKDFNKEREAAGFSANRYGEDQNFLSSKIYPPLLNNCIVHDGSGHPVEWNERNIRRNFPSERESEEYVGKPFSEHDTSLARYWSAQKH